MSTRTESDSLGPVDVPAERLWGAQTERARQHFDISCERQPLEMLRALALVKQAAAEVLARLGWLPQDRAAAIGEAAAEVLAGRHDEEFPLVVWQTGSGTQTHMNMNEVLANRASELMGGVRGASRCVHPNDDLNRGQSSNDIYPTALHVAAVMSLRAHLLPALARLQQALAVRVDEFDGLVKIGRTHLQDATPLTLGQEFSAYVDQLDQARRHIEASLPHLSQLAVGGTAVGTGLNAPRGFGEAVAAQLAQRTGLPFVAAPNKFAALAAEDAVVHAHGALKGLAASLTKLANDIRWLASGPRCGLGELQLPENEPGSSIMPGKVNPTQCEALLMACCQVFGNDVVINLSGSSGHFQLNTSRPLMAHAFLQSARLLADAMSSFEAHAVRGLQPEPARLAELVGRSLMLVTALTPHIGYDRAARIAMKAHHEGSTLREAALALGEVSAEDFDAWVQPGQMVGKGGP